MTGTRRTDRSSTDSASPVDVIGGPELASQPAINLLDMVKNVVPSFYVPQNSISDASTFVRAPSLRGLGADQVLVMINGKRYNRAALVQVYTGADTALSFGSQGADIGNIPAIAIDNLQILRDGATAQYGSDAIGGVINYQISKSTDLEAQVVYGKSYRDRLRHFLATCSRTAAGGIAPPPQRRCHAAIEQRSRRRGRSRATKAGWQSGGPGSGQTVPCGAGRAARQGRLGRRTIRHDFPGGVARAASAATARPVCSASEQRIPLRPRRAGNRDRRRGTSAAAPRR